MRTRETPFWKHFRTAPLLNTLSRLSVADRTHVVFPVCDGQFSVGPFHGRRFLEVMSTMLKSDEVDDDEPDTRLIISAVEVRKLPDEERDAESRLSASENCPYRRTSAVAMGPWATGAFRLSDDLVISIRQRPQPKRNRVEMWKCFLVAETVWRSSLENHAA